MATTTPVGTWSSAQKVGEALRRSLPHLPAHLRGQVEMLLTPEALAMITGVLVVWAGAHFTGVGEVADLVLLTVGVFAIGAAVGYVTLVSMWSEAAGILLGPVNAAGMFYQAFFSPGEPVPSAGK